MATHESLFGIERSLLRLEGDDPYLCLHFVIIFVRDQERSLRFYVDNLGFRVAVDHKFEDGRRWIEVAPPDGNAHIGLAPVEAGADIESLISKETRIWFITEDVNRKYEEWRARGVHFRFPPQVPAWGGIHTRFEDPDGNSFGLAGFDELTRGVEAKRRALAHSASAMLTADISPALFCAPTTSCAGSTPRQLWWVSFRIGSASSPTLNFRPETCSRFTPMALPKL